MNYKIITDMSLLEDFVHNFLPDLEKNETYYVCLFARSKYQDPSNKTLAHIKSDKAQLKRFVSTKDRLISKIQQLECPLGAYKQYGTNKPTVDIPQETLALYITPNPRNLYKATKGSIKKFVELICDGDDHIVNPHGFCMSEIQKSRSRTCFVDFDFDDVSIGEVSSKIEDIFQGNQDAYNVLETRGGFHLLVEPSKIKESTTKNWYKLLQYMSNVDQTGDCMIPIPGTYQGGFTPRLL